MLTEASSLHATVSWPRKGNFVPLYYSLTRPHLEYAIQNTFSYLKKDVDYVERVQPLATSKVKGTNTISYAERLSELDLQTLEHRRVQGDLMVALFNVQWPVQPCV